MKRGTSILLRAVGAVGALVVLLIVLFPGNPLLLWFMYNYGPEENTKWIQSPDGQWSAQIRTRAAMDHINSRLFLRQQGRDPKEVMHVSGMKPLLAWSPNSRWIATTDEASKHLSVYDVKSGHSEDEYPKYKFNLDRIIPDNDQDTWHEIKWAWRGANKVVFYDDASRHQDGTVLARRRIVDCEIVNTRSRLRIYCRLIQHKKHS